MSPARTADFPVDTWTDQVPRSAEMAADQRPSSQVGVDETPAPHQLLDRASASMRGRMKGLLFELPGQGPFGCCLCECTLRGKGPERTRGRRPRRVQQA